MAVKFKRINRIINCALIIVLTISISGCGYNTLQSQDEYVTAGWSSVLAEYQRRSDLIPNVVNVVKLYAKHEKDLLTEIAYARSAIDSLKVSVNSLNNPEIVNRYVQYQQRLDKSLSKLNIIIEKYPDLKADEIFLDLHVQLEGTENRIATARHEYIYAVYNFNVTVRSFPSNLTAKLFGYKTKPQYFSNDENNIPKVEIK